MSRRWRIVLIVVFVVLIAAQLIPVSRTNLAPKAPVEAPVEVMAILRGACYDCHSSETRWPWYSRIAPVSWLVASDVSEARDKFNLSDWGLLPPKKQEDLREDMWEEVEKGAMPLWFYRIAHAESRLTAAQEATLRQWGIGAAK